MTEEMALRPYQIAALDAIRSNPVFVPSGCRIMQPLDPMRRIFPWRPPFATTAVRAFLARPGRRVMVYPQGMLGIVIIADDLTIEEMDTLENWRPAGVYIRYGDDVADHLANFAERVEAFARRAQPKRWF